MYNGTNKNCGGVLVYRGEKYPLYTTEDVRALRRERPIVWANACTRSPSIMRLLLLAYDEELDSQDLKGSSGSYGKMFEVESRMAFHLERGTAMYLRDFRARRLGRVDTRTGGIDIEIKSGFCATWIYQVETKNEGFEKLESLRNKVYHWDAFKDGRIWRAPLGEILDALASYNPKKGLETWFVLKNGNLDMRPVLNSVPKTEFMERIFEELEKAGRL